MQNQEINKEWYNKNEILELYPMGVTTYKKRIRKLNSPKYSKHTRLITKKLSESNLKKIQVREIHKDVLEDLFGNIRRPNQNNINNVIKWVNNCNWDWFGDIVPSNTLPYELKGKMHFLFNRLKKCVGGDCRMTMFYSIEKNTGDNYYHCHFLIKNGDCILNEKVINENLELISEINTSKETRIYLKAYDYKNYGRRGSNYTLKNFQYGYEILK